MKDVLLFIGREILSSDVDSETIGKILVVGYGVAEAGRVGRLLHSVPFDRLVAETVTVRHFLRVRTHENLSKPHLFINRLFQIQIQSIY